MKTVIAGTRTLSRTHLESALDRYEKPVTEVVSGCVGGIDTAAIEWASENSIPVSKFPPSEVSVDDPRPNTLVRNEQMAEYGEALLAIWDGDSNGTEHMIQMAEKHGMDVTIHRTDSRTLEEFE